MVSMQSMGVHAGGSLDGAGIILLKAKFTFWEKISAHISVKKKSVHPLFFPARAWKALHPRPKDHGCNARLLWTLSMGAYSTCTSHTGRHLLKSRKLNTRALISIPPPVHWELQAVCHNGRR